MKSISYKRIISSGDYLGFDEDFGFIYSVFIGYRKDGSPEYGVYSLRGQCIECLIVYPILVGPNSKGGNER